MHIEWRPNRCGRNSLPSVMWVEMLALTEELARKPLAASLGALQKNPAFNSGLSDTNSAPHKITLQYSVSPLTLNSWILALLTLSDKPLHAQPQHGTFHAAGPKKYDFSSWIGTYAQHIFGNYHCHFHVSVGFLKATPMRDRQLAFLTWLP